MVPVSPLTNKIGLGCVTFGREIDRKSSFLLLDHAFQRGIRFLDTARAYGDGASERIVGEWMAAHRLLTSSITVATKILPPFTPDVIRSSLDESLKRLGTETIDLLYFHRWDGTAEDVPALKMMSDLVAEGKVRFLGASNFTLEQLRRTLRLQSEHGLTGFGFVQNNNNFAVREIDEAFCAVCAARDIRIVTYSPLGAGFLTGKHRQTVQPGSRFALVPGHQEIYFQPASIRRLGELTRIAARTGLSTTTLALAWALQQPKVSRVLISGRIPAHIDQAFDALTVEFPDLPKEDCVNLKNR